MGRVPTSIRSGPGTSYAGLKWIAGTGGSQSENGKVLSANRRTTSVSDAPTRCTDHDGSRPASIGEQRRPCPSDRAPVVRVGGRPRASSRSRVHAASWSSARPLDTPVLRRARRVLEDRTPVGCLGEATVFESAVRARRDRSGFARRRGPRAHDGRASRTWSRSRRALQTGVGEFAHVGDRIEQLRDPVMAERFALERTSTRRPRSSR